MDLGKVIYDVLSTDSDVISLVGDNEAGDAKRIFPVKASYKETLPLVIYQIGNTQPTDVKDSNSGLDLVDVDVYIYGSTYAQCTTLAEYVRDALDGYYGTNNSVEVDRIWFDTYEETWDNEAEKPVIIHSYQVRILRDGSAPAAGITPSGRMYYKPIRNFDNTASTATGDYGYHRDLGVYQNSIPANPQYIMQLDDTQSTELLRGKTLKVNNVFSNKNRFTALDGSQTYPDAFFIDHLTGLGWWMENAGAGNRATAITHANNSTSKSYSDWRVPTSEEWLSICIQQNGTRNDLAALPVVIPNSTSLNFWALNNAAGFESSFGEYFNTDSGRILYQAITTTNTRYGVLVRNQYTSG